MTAIRRFHTNSVKLGSYSFTISITYPIYLYILLPNPLPDYQFGTHFLYHTIYICTTSLRFALHSIDGLRNNLSGEYKHIILGHSSLFYITGISSISLTIVRLGS